jgi:uncharacterized protein (TIGR03067 family)
MRAEALLVLTGVVVVAAGSFTVRAAQDKAKDDVAKMEGTWKIVSWEQDGKAVSGEYVKKVVVTVKGDRFTLMTPDATTEGRFKVDVTKKPKEIDATPAKGAFEGKTLRGVYELSGDTCKACFAPPGKDRPREFSSKKGSGHILFVGKRQKAKP